MLLCESPVEAPRLTFSPSSFVSPSSTVPFMSQKMASTGGAALAPNSVRDEHVVAEDDAWRCWVNLLLVLWECLAVVWTYRLFRG